MQRNMEPRGSLRDGFRRLHRHHHRELASTWDATISSLWDPPRTTPPSQRARGGPLFVIWRPTSCWRRWPTVSQLWPLPSREGEGNRCLCCTCPSRRKDTAAASDLRTWVGFAAVRSAHFPRKRPWRAQWIDHVIFLSPCPSFPVTRNGHGWEASAFCRGKP